MKPDTKRLMVHSALMWIVAIGIPVVVMIVFDAFNIHTPTNIASWSSILIFFVFGFHNVWLGGQLKRIGDSAPHV